MEFQLFNDNNRSYLEKLYFAQRIHGLVGWAASYWADVYETERRPFIHSHSQKSVSYGERLSCVGGFLRMLPRKTEGLPLERGGEACCAAVHGVLLQQCSPLLWHNLLDLNS